jgi:hypothetical protein
MKLEKYRPGRDFSHYAKIHGAYQKDPYFVKRHQVIHRFKVVIHKLKSKAVENFKWQFSDF